jgi:predicted nucleotidyltransferase
MVEFPTKKTFEILSLFTDYTILSLNVSKISLLLDLSHVTLLPHIDELIKKDILSYEIRGRNKELKLNKKQPLTSIFLEMTENYKLQDFVQKNIFFKKIIHEIKDFNNPIVLFGSYAKGNLNKESDIDIAIIGTKNNNLIQKFEYLSQIVGKDINLKFISSLNNFNNPLIFEIIKYHIVLNNSSLFVKGVFHEKD